MVRFTKLLREKRDRVVKRRVVLAAGVEREAFVPIARARAVAEEPRTHARDTAVGGGGEPRRIGLAPGGGRQAAVTQAELADDERARHATRGLLDGRAA